MKKLRMPNPLPAIPGFFRRFHMTLFIIIVLTALGGAVLLLASIINDTSLAADYQSPIRAGSIDQATLDRINALHRSNGDLPNATTFDGRSPFSE